MARNLERAGELEKALELLTPLNQASRDVGPENPLYKVGCDGYNKWGWSRIERCLNLVVACYMELEQPGTARPFLTELLDIAKNDSNSKYIFMRGMDLGVCLANCGCMDEAQVVIDLAESSKAGPVEQCPGTSGYSLKPRDEDLALFKCAVCGILPQSNSKPGCMCTFFLSPRCY